MISGGNQLPVLSWLAVSALVDRSALADAVAQASALNEQHYTADSWDALVGPLAAAQAVLDDSNASQAEVDAVLPALAGALSALVDARQPLIELMDELSALTSAPYTFASWQVFALARAQAWAVLDGPLAERAEVAERIEQLNTAQAGLIYR
ncbi:MAG: FIVAR domain-containing protein, partial [Propionibacteriaceae bacterium]|nr:FIVAR domain-containing protein [Propionibacteriaceae bacterium]